MKIERGDLRYSRVLLREIAGRYNREIARMREEADEYKHAAAAMFWVKKLKPIYIWQDQNMLLNEMFAFYMGVGAILAGQGTKRSLDVQYKAMLRELFYALRYRNMTPQNMDFILKIMFPPSYL